MPTIKYICKECGHVESITRAQAFWQFVWTLGVALGVVFIILLIFIGPTIMINGALGSLHTYYAQSKSSDLRFLALEYTTYSGSDPFKWALDLAQNIGKIRYVPASPYHMLQQPSETYIYGGDCKNSAIMYTSMLQTLDVPTTVSCDHEKRHCVTRIDDGSYYMIVDLTSNDWFIFQKEYDFWATPDNFAKHGNLLYKEPLDVVEPRNYEE